MRKRTLWIGLGALAGLWLLPAIFVALYDPAASPMPGSLQWPVRGGPAVPDPKSFLLSHGYAKQWTVVAWDGEDSEAPLDAPRASYSVVRGPLDRKAATFRFRVACRVSPARDLEALRLFVTNHSDGTEVADRAHWVRVAEARVEPSGATEVALVCEADIPAATTAYRVQEVRGGVPTGGFTQSMLTAPTALGRIYDSIAWRWPFRWLPDL